MDNELILKLRYIALCADRADVRETAGQAADALEAKAAPVYECPRCGTGMEVDSSAKPSKAETVGELREAFDRWFIGEKGIHPDTDTTNLDSAYMPYRAYKAGAAHQRQQAREVVSDAARDVLAERQRQITAEDFDASHDDMATRGQIAMAAGLYALDAAGLAAGRASLSHPSSLWPWPDEWWKPAGSRRNLVKAGALILAEIERLDRLNKGAGSHE